MKGRGVVVQDLIPGSAAERAGIRRGDRIVAAGGERVLDLIDFHFHGGDEEELILQLEGAEGERRTVTVRRRFGESLGLVLAPPEPRRCGNNCIFCFVHQLPDGLRPPLYVKDEDYRLSFLYGNYVTLSNLSRRDLERIVTMRLSPLYVSVHATDREVRAHLLGRREPREIGETLRRLSEGGIRFHTQIVLLPDVNDGSVFERTIDDLCSLGSAILSIAVVPVGLTGHRTGLPEIRPVDGVYAASFLERCEPLRKRLNRERGRGFLSFADEWYLRGGKPFPPPAEYGDFPQLENGVGMIPLFQSHARRVIARARPLPSVVATLVTGSSAAPVIKRFCADLSTVTGSDLRVVPVENRLFGLSVTVAGLVVGRDIVESCRDRELGDALILPDVMLKEGEGVFLDDMTVDGLSAILKVPVVVVETSPAGILRGVRTLARRRMGAGY